MVGSTEPPPVGGCFGGWIQGISLVCGEAVEVRQVASVGTVPIEPSIPERIHDFEPGCGRLPSVPPLAEFGLPAFAQLFVILQMLGKGIEAGRR